MIDLQQATLFLDLQSYLVNIGGCSKFIEFARNVWPNRWEQMFMLWYQKCDQDPWHFCCCLDPLALQELISYYNQLNL